MNSSDLLASTIGAANAGSIEIMGSGLDLRGTTVTSTAGEGGEAGSGDAGSVLLRALSGGVTVAENSTLSSRQSGIGASAGAGGTVRIEAGGVDPTTGVSVNIVDSQINAETASDTEAFDDPASDRERRPDPLIVVQTHLAALRQRQRQRASDRTRA